MKYNKLQFNKKGAFSLVEVLISLVLISLVMVATAPIITKKLPKKQTTALYIPITQITMQKKTTFAI